MACLQEKSSYATDSWMLFYLSFLAGSLLARSVMMNAGRISLHAMSLSMQCMCDLPWAGGALDFLFYHQWAMCCSSAQFMWFLRLLLTASRLLWQQQYIYWESVWYLQPCLHVANFSFICTWFEQESQQHVYLFITCLPYIHEEDAMCYDQRADR
jgi:hypothetical protein